jgi:hypothetical protein
MNPGTLARPRGYGSTSFTTRPASPPSPTATDRRPFSATFSSASISRRRISIGFCSSRRAVFACEGMAAVSSRRVMSAASAAFCASMTLFMSSFMSPGSTTSRMPSETTSGPIPATRERSAPSRSRATASFSPSSASSVRAPTTARRASCASRQSAWRWSSTVVTALRASVTLNVATAFMRSVTLSAVMISWPATSTTCSRRSTGTTFARATPFQSA